MEPAYNVNPKYVRLVPTCEAAARILTQNLMYGVEEDTKYNSAEELIKMGRQLDILQSSEETVTTDVNNEEWDCQP